MAALTLRDRRVAAAAAVLVVPLLLGALVLRDALPSGAAVPDGLPGAAAAAAAEPLPESADAPADAPAVVGVPADLPQSAVLRLASAGLDRAVLVQDPPGGQPAQAVLVVLGGHALTAARSAADLRFDALRAAGWALAYPSTVDGDWNAGRCCGSPAERGVDDVRFLQDVRGLLQERYDVPDDRVALVGYSTGGQMAYRVACEHPGYARALLIVAGSLETDCAPGAPLPPTLVVHGDADTTVPWAEPAAPLAMIDFAPTPLLETLHRFSRAVGCSDRREDRRDGRLLVVWQTCTHARSLTFAGMPGVGHGWDDLRASVYAERFLPSVLPSARS